MPRLPPRRSAPLLLLLSLLSLLHHAAPSGAEPACPTVLPNPPDPRIVGGVPAPPQLAVYLAALFNERSRFRCSATILAPGWLLTARHCNVSAAWTAVLSTADRTIGNAATIAEVIPHPSPGERHDLTLLRLAVTPAPLPVPPLLLNADPSAPRVSSFARTAGYGRRDYDDARNTRLRQVDVPIVDASSCESAYGASVVDARVCAGYAAGGCDSCTGDSGGPLLQYDARLRPVLLAAVSAGKNCALPGFPGLYAPIHPVLGWLREHGVVFDTGTPSDSPAAAATDPVDTPSPSPSPSPVGQPADAAGDADVATGDGDGEGDGEGDTATSDSTEDAIVSGDDAASTDTTSSAGGADDDVAASDAAVDDTVAVPDEEASREPPAAPTASPAPADSEVARQNGQGGLSGGSVAGIAVAGVAVGVVLIVASVCYVMMPRRTDAAVAV